MRTKLPLLALALAVLPFLPSHIQAQSVCFLPQVTYTTGTAPVGVTTADFNGDGFKDIATCNQASSNVSIFLGTGNGTFGAATNFTTAVQPYGIASGDFNNDGKVDLVTGNLNNSNNYSVLLGNGNGGFGANTDFVVTGKPNSIAVADINGDANLDLAMVAAGTSNAIVVLGNGNGTFGAPAYYAIGGTSPEEIAFGKFNGDANWDLAITCQASDNVCVLLGNNFGGFASGIPYSVGVGTGPRGIAVADYNGDGFKDIASANNTNATISILTGSGTGSFVLGANFATGPSPRGLVNADFNSDGKKDLAVTNFGGNSVGVYLGNGNGTFAAVTTLPAGGATNHLAVNDFNGDGKTDIATVNQSAFTSSVLLNNAPTVTASAASTNICSIFTSDLLTGTPGGGTFSGTGVTANNFDPSVAGQGTFTITYTYTDMNGCTNSKQMNITVFICTGIIENANDDAVVVYPNPGDGYLNLEYDEISFSSLAIYNSCGSLVYSSDEIKKEIDLSGEAKGIYMLRVISRDKVFNRKLIIR